MPTFTPTTAQLSIPAFTQDVFRYLPDAEDDFGEDDNRFEILPNIICLNVAWHEGATPQTAQFQYILDSTNPDSPFPILLEELWPLQAKGKYVVQNDDRLLVFVYDPDGEAYILFDGFATIPQVDQSSQGLTVTFAAVGVGVRLWDQPVKGSTWRDADKPTTEGLEVVTELPAHFNPTVDGERKGNATGKDYDVYQGEDFAYPVFLDPSIELETGTPYPADWTLGMFCRYLAWTENFYEEYVKNPKPINGTTLDDYLRSFTPTSSTGYMDLEIPDTYDAKPIVIRSFIAANKPWLVSVEEQLGYYGFRVRFDIKYEEDFTPVNYLTIYRVDGLDSNEPKTLYFPPYGTSLTEGIPAFQGASVVRDQSQAANQYRVETANNEYEASLILGLGFAALPDDELDVRKYDTSALAGATNEMRKAYRYFVFDEAGMGHFDLAEGEWIYDEPTSLDEILGEPDEDGVRQYVHRQRRGSTQLISKDAMGRLRHAELAISTDYPGEYPAVWDGTGSWRSMGSSHWRLDDESLSIWITADNPAKWTIPKGDGQGGAAGVVNVVTALANPDATFAPKFFLRLTVRFSGDKGIGIVAKKRDATPMKFAVENVIESREHWVKQVIKYPSAFNLTGEDFAEAPKVRDDTKDAQAQADAQRLATEMPPIAGPFVVPWITFAYTLGDLISGIDRGEKFLSFSGNAGGTAETPRYPIVVGMTWNLVEGGQSTTIHLSDKRSQAEKAMHGRTGGKKFHK